MRCAIQIIGSLLWDDDEARINWRKERLLLDKKMTVRASFHYGRISQKRGNTYTMTFGTDEPASMGVLIPCKANIESIDDLMTEARCLWGAETKSDPSDPFGKKWGCVGALFGPKPVERGLQAIWRDRFRKANKVDRTGIDADGKLTLSWPQSITGEPMTGLDVILATATTPEAARPDAKAIARAWLDGRHEEYFFENVRHGIRTPDDLAIWKHLEAARPQWLECDAYAVPVKQLRDEVAALSPPAKNDEAQ